MASSRRWAALPVGAAIAMASIGTPVHASARTSATTIVVFPVPGPPLSSASREASAVRSARFCSSVRGGGPAATAAIALLMRRASEPAGAERRARTPSHRRSSSRCIRSVESHSPSRTSGLRCPGGPITAARGPSPRRARRTSERAAPRTSAAPTAASAAANRASSRGILVEPARSAPMQAAARAVMARCTPGSVSDAQRAISHPRYAASKSSSSTARAGACSPLGPSAGEPSRKRAFAVPSGVNALMSSSRRSTSASPRALAPSERDLPSLAARPRRRFRLSRSLGGNNRAGLRSARHVHPRCECPGV